MEFSACVGESEGRCCPFPSFAGVRHQLFFVRPSAASFVAVSLVYFNLFGMILGTWKQSWTEKLNEIGVEVGNVEIPDLHLEIPHLNAFVPVAS